MTTFMQEFLSLLTQQPGNLIYYIVLAFSVAATLPTAWTFARSYEHPFAGRVLLGLIPVLLVLLLSFLIGSLAWQGVIVDNNMLPALDRGVTLFSLVLIIWLWAYPEPVRFADMVTLLLILAIVSLTAVNIAWWSNQSELTPYNSVLAERISQIFALFCILIGIVQLIIRRPPVWANGFFMLMILFVGHLVQLIYPDWQSSFAGPVRLAQIVAYPILLSLPQRFIPTAKRKNQQLSHVDEVKIESPGEKLDSSQLLSDQERLPDSMAHLLQQDKAQEDLSESYQKMSQSYQVLEAELELVQQEKQDLLVKLTESQALIREKPSKPFETQPNLDELEHDQEVMAGIRAEIKQLNQALISSSAEKDTLAGELKLALEEVARLRSVSETAGGMIKEKSSFALTERQMGDCMQAMLQTRQPISAIADYTDLLLGESIGSLSDLQHRILERIKSVTEQMTTLIDEVQKLVPQDDPSMQLRSQDVLLNDVVDSVLVNISDVLKSKSITVSSDLQANLLHLRADRHVVEQVISRMIMNACNVTPPDGQIFLHSEFKGDSEEGNYVLFQITDQGGGTVEKNLSEQLSALTTPISGVDETSEGLAMIKELVEASGGWIWVDRESNVGSICSVLFPAASTLSASKAQDREWNTEV